MTMDTTWIEIGGIVIQSPVTAGTNVVLSVQCFIYFRRLRREFHGLGTERASRSRMWGGFFATMAIATLAGAFKHGFQHELSQAGLHLVLWASNAAGGISTYFAQRASLVFHAPHHLERRFDRLFQVQLFLFLAGNVVLGPQLIFLLANTAAGLLPVIGMEARAFLRGYRGAGWIAGGLSVSIITGAVYATQISVGPWLNHVDIAHLLMAGSFWLMVRGCGPHLVAVGERLVTWPLMRRIADAATTSGPGGS
jgi:hypothetical protein